MLALAQRASTTAAFFCVKTDAQKRNRYRFRPATRTKPSRRLLIWSRGIVLAVAVLSFISPAWATFPGQNGHIAYNPSTTLPAGGNYSYISLVGAGQFTFPPAGVLQDTDSSPAWSPSGSQLAFVRRDLTTLVGQYLIEVVASDGTGTQTVFSSSALNGPLSEISSLAWTPDGQRISFFVFDAGPGTARDTVLGSTTGIWTVNLDGTGLTEVVSGVPNHNGSSTLLSNLEGLNGNNPVATIFLEWSSKNELAFTCNFRLNNITADLCVLNADTGQTRQLPIIWPNSVGFAQGTFHPSPWDWSPDGTKIAFSDFPGNVGLGREPGQQIFSINADGTGLTQLTNPSLLTCPANTFGGSFFSANYSNPRYSPDGQFIAATTESGAHLTTFPAPPGEGEPDSCGPIGAVPSISVLPAHGGSSSILTAFSFFTSSQASAPLDWQSIPQALTVNLDDGHGDALKGIKVELRAIDDSVVDAQPINTVGGAYVFQNGASYTGEFLIRATLIDNTAPSGSQPAFDIRYADAPTGPVWIETKLALNDEASTHSFSFSADEPNLSSWGPALPSDGKSRLADMAAICFRMGQYVDWIRARLTPSSAPTVSVRTFVTYDPAGNLFTAGSAYYPSDLIGPGAIPEILLDAIDSSYETRDPLTTNPEGPENNEWHEFTHHIYAMFINNRNTCAAGSQPHLGYNNPDTCDSMDEGFAEFLPTLAARDIIVNPSSLSDSFYDHVGDLQWPYQAWSDHPDATGNAAIQPPLVVGNQSYEDMAVAALLWDLVARSGNSQLATVIGASGSLQATIYTNPGPNIPIGQLWTQLNTAQPATVWDLRQSFNTPVAPAITIDLDGDKVPDVAPVDMPFLMHGFYPIDSDQLRTTDHTVDSYDVAYASRKGAAARNAFVGQSAHHVYNSEGVEEGPPQISQLLIPNRYKAPHAPNANIALTSLDAIGAPIPGATVNISIAYAGGQTLISRPLQTGSGDLVHLELLPYFNYLLPDGAPLPTCDPMHDVQMTVTLSVTAQGQTSTTTPSFDNCAYLHAVAAATTPAALSFTVIVPVIGNGGGDTVPPTTTLALSPQANGAGWNNSSVRATLAATDNAGGSGVKQITFSGIGAQTIASTVVNGNSASFTINTEGVTTITFFGTDNAGNVESTNTQTIQIDKTPPSINCGAPDGIWHASDVSIACTAADLVSGLANSTDASFSLLTNVPAGTETSSAATATHSVCDVAGNCAAAGPIAGNMVDKKAPNISVSSPASGASYLVNQAVNANFTCTDGGSGVATCAGTVANGSAISTASAGSKSFTVNATDNVGNAAPTQTISYSVTNVVCLLYDPTRSVQSGSTIPLKIQLCDANNADVSTSNVVVHAVSLVQTSTNASAVLQASGDANPDNDFRFDPTLGSTGGYIFNLSTKGLTTGSYQLTFASSSDPTSHILSFQVR